MNRWRIAAVLVTRTPLHIGSPDTRKLKERGYRPRDVEDPEYATVVTDNEGKPYIPGSALKGTLRELLRSRGFDGNAHFNDLFGEAVEGEKKGRAGKAIFEDAFLEEVPANPKGVPYWDASRSTAVATSVAIDRRTNTAQDQKLFHFEFVPCGTRFRLEIQLTDCGRECAGLLMTGLHAIGGRDGISLGAGGSSGWGEMSIEGISVQIAGEEELETWLGRLVDWSANPELEEPPKLGFSDAGPLVEPQPASLPKRPALAIELEFSGSFLVNDPSRTRVKGVDETKDWPNHTPLRDREDRPYLPARSVRGVLRSHAEKILRTLSGDTAACHDGLGSGRCQVRKKPGQPSDYEPVCPACQVFGAAGRRSPLGVSDFRAKKSPAEFVQDFVAISPFTGGAARGAKFNARAAARPVLAGSLEFDLEAMARAGAGPWTLGLIAMLIRDLQAGFLTFGFGAAKGNGRCQGRIAELPDSWLRRLIEASPKSWRKALGLRSGIAVDPTAINGLLKACLEALPDTARESKKLPVQIDRVPPAEPATAPFNFVPLPSRPLDPNSMPWRRQDRWLPGTLTGYMEIELRTLTPTFIRGATEVHDPPTGKAIEARLRPEPFKDTGGNPLLPASSLRGAIRNLFGILTHSKVQPVDDGRLFFRTVKGGLGDVYRKRLRLQDRNPAKDVDPEAGFLACVDGAWSIQPVAPVLRVRHNELTRVFGTEFEYRQKPDYFPNRAIQHLRCWALEGTPGRCTELRLQDPGSEPGWKPGALVLTGAAPQKDNEFVFVGTPEPEKPGSVPIPASLWEEFCSDDQLTNWQEKAFPSEEGSGRKAGTPKSGDPVFFIRHDSEVAQGNPSGLVFFGRAFMFRLPFDLSPRDFVPAGLSSAELDMAETVFGRVPLEGQDEQASLRGRVEMEDARVTSEARPEGGWFERYLIPRILASPKPTAFQEYLVQDGNAGERELKAFFSSHRGKTVIRGHKLYWHRWDAARGLEQVALESPAPLISENPEPLLGRANRDNQLTVIRPVKADVTFTTRMWFENLAPVELGALLDAVQLPPECAHKLGMGKPLGLGSVRLDMKSMTLMNPHERYRNPAETGLRQLTREAPELETCRRLFRITIQAHAVTTGDRVVSGNGGFGPLGRLDDMYRLLTWTGRPPRESTDYQELGTFSERRVLPSPGAVLGPREVPSGDPPAPPVAGMDVDTAEIMKEPLGTGPLEELAPSDAEEPRPLRVGDLVRCTVIRKTSKGRPEFSIAGTSKLGNLEGRIDLPAGWDLEMAYELMISKLGARIQLVIP